LTSRDERGQEFRAELRAREALQHPNILPVLDSGVDGSSRNFVIMPLCKHDLRALLRRQHFIPPADALQILRQVAAALDYAHSRGILHGDVKPENILFGANGSIVLLADFGIARFFGFREAITATVGGAGTTAYISPEQLSDLKQTTRSDIYSFAIVAYEILAGGHPIDPDDSPYLQMRNKVEGVLRDPVALNPLISQPLAESIMAGLRKEPAARPATATEYCEGIARAMEGRSASSVSTAKGKAPARGTESSRKDSEKESPSSYLELVLYVLRRPLLLCTALVLLIALFSLDYWQTPPGSTVTLFGIKLFDKGAPSSGPSTPPTRE
jgi:serine/threonine-protein kinase